jgi:restriction system protein
LCTHCGRQVEELKQETASTPSIVINNSNLNTNTNTNTNINAAGRVGRAKNKWVSILLCLFLGYFGAHKFYEGKTIMGILYIFTCGLFCIGAIIDFFILLGKPNPYYV